MLTLKWLNVFFMKSFLVWTEINWKVPYFHIIFLAFFRSNTSWNMLKQAEIKQMFSTATIRSKIILALTSCKSALHLFSSLWVTLVVSTILSKPRGQQRSRVTGSPWDPREIIVNMIKENFSIFLFSGVLCWSFIAFYTASFSWESGLLTSNSNTLPAPFYVALWVNKQWLWVKWHLCHLQSWQVETQESYSWQVCWSI